MQKKRRNKKRKNKIKAKKAQVLGMPFAMLFSIILIIITVFVGFFVIRTFLERADQSKINLFIADLQAEAIDVWQAEEASKTIDLALTKKINYICFVDWTRACNSLILDCNQASLYPDSNMFLLPLGKAEDLGTKSNWYMHCGTRDRPKDCLEFSQNPTCIPVINGKFSAILTNKGDKKVEISEA